MLISDIDAAVRLRNDRTRADQLKSSLMRANSVLGLTTSGPYTSGYRGEIGCGEPLVRFFIEACDKEIERCEERLAAMGIRKEPS